MSKTLLTALLLAGAFAAFAADKPATGTSSADVVARGRYLVMIGGCNDCHTPGFALAGGHVPEAQWLTGDALGWHGEWGTTYPPNLRLKLNAMDLATWTSYAKGLKTRPPMPYWAINAMSDADLEALWARLTARFAPRSGWSHEDRMPKRRLAIAVPLVRGGRWPSR
jgi:mono/diheme cytochrome c family protein